MKTTFNFPASDPIAQFCHDLKLTTVESETLSEKEIAREFVSFFEIPPVFDISDLAKFCATTNITVKREALPGDLMGMNCCFGSVRVVVISNRDENLLFQEHTALHEIREIIEYGFQELGLRTAESDLELRANEFASYVLQFAAEGGLRQTKELQNTPSIYAYLRICLAALFSHLPPAHSES